MGSAGLTGWAMTAATLLVLGACRGAAETPQAACRDVGPAVSADLADRLTVAGGGTVSSAKYVALQPPAEGAAVPGAWYAVAATLEGPGVKALKAAWITTADLSRDEPGGRWYSADDMAVEFSTHPAPSDVPSWVVSSPGILGAAACLQE